ncbi:DUF445 domain-containing protein [Leptospira langatensis]|uniref:DUF445 domain-containing protein n=1 Tax=Leptospira langatensis TaxID=2484983 RepID=A0A5F1ZZW9_9LEPT|nr:DUF445 domain-containing protein [Leptospira langatensis]TGL43790.1 DUF445 domain-containing protein [Leptospira langatensis]
MRLYGNKPYSRLQFVSNLLLVLFGGSLLSGFYFGWSSYAWGNILVHGLEGGLVGAICDWFAVWKTYKAVEAQSESIAEEIGSWVSTDLLNEHKLKSYLDEILDGPENIRIIRELLDKHIHGEKEIREFLDLVWNKVEEDIVLYVTNFKFSGADKQILHELNRRKEILLTVRFLVGEALVKATDKEDFGERIDKITKGFSFLAKPLIWLIDPKKRIREFGEGLKEGKDFQTEEEEVLFEVFSLFSECAELYVGSWNELPDHKRQEAVRALADFGKEQLNRLISELVLSHKEELSKLENLREYGPIRGLLEFLRSKTSESVSQYVGEQIAKGLKLLEPKQFRENLEMKTRRVLERIRINGSLLGFLVGSCIGILVLLFQS